MKPYIVCLFFILALSGPTFGQQTTVPNVVRIEGMDELVNLLQRIDKGVSRLADSRWEYRIVQRNRFSDDLVGRIEALGRDGWELVNATVQEGFIFKRRVSQ